MDFVLTESLVDLLVKASPYLKSFQGEDVSLAIWVEGLTGTSVNSNWNRVEKKEIQCWLSTPRCPNYFIKRELTPEAFYKLHFNI